MSTPYDDLTDLGEVSPGNDLEVLVRLTTTDASSGQLVPLLGRTDITLALATSLAGAAAFPDLQATMGEVPGGRGLYYGVIDGGALATRWGAGGGPADGDVIFPIVVVPNDRRRPFKATWRNPARR